MKDIANKIKGIIVGAFCLSLLFVILGICFIVFPYSALNIIRWVLCIMALASGIALIVADFSRRIPGFGTSAAGAILVVIGLALAFHPSVMNIFSIALGVWFIITAISTLRLGLGLEGFSGIIAILSALVSLACGVLLILNPWGGQIYIMTFVGIMMIVYGVSSMANTITFSLNLSELEQKFKSIISINSKTSSKK